MQLEQQQVRRLEQQQRQQLEQQQVLEQQLEQPLVQVQELLLSCRKQPEQQQQRWRPKRGICSFFDSLMR